LADLVPAASEPVWPGYGGAAGYAPWLAAGLSGIPGFALRTALLIWLVTLSDRVSGRWARRRLPLGLGYLLLGVLLVNQGDLSRWPLWLAAGLAIGACLLWLYAAFLRFDRSLAVPIVATVIGLDLVRVAAQRNYPGAAVGAGLSLAFIAALAWWWWSWLARAGSPA
jgi:phosphoglycerol transferase MdoB-like AlkP superfamily enzyme